MDFPLEWTDAKKVNAFRASSMAFSICCAGCAPSLGLFKPSVSSVSLPSGSTLKQSGAAGDGAKVSEFSVRATLPVPAGSSVELGAVASDADRAKVAASFPASRLVLSSPSILTLESSGASSVAATVPAASSGLASIADVGASSFRWFVVAGLVLALAAGIAFYTTHFLAAIKLSVAAVAVPALAWFISSHVALVVGASLVSVAVFAVWVWFSQVKPANELRELAEEKARDFSDKLRGTFRRDSR
jgi:hypothetical protein